MIFLKSIISVVFSQIHRCMRDMYFYIYFIFVYVYWVDFIVFPRKWEMWYLVLCTEPPQIQELKINLFFFLNFRWLSSAKLI